MSVPMKKHVYFFKFVIIGLRGVYVNPVKSGQGINNNIFFVTYSNWFVITSPNEPIVLI